MNDQHWGFIAKRDTHLYMEDPAPWLAPGVTDEILARVPAHEHVFEWGAGSSTLWFVSHAIKVTSFETHEGWAEDVRARGRGHADVRHLPAEGAYLTPDLDGYALVLIDGRRRNECGLHAAKTSPPGQLVVFDDSHREAYRAAMEALSQRAVWQRHWPGLSAMMTPKMTSMFRL